MREALALAGDYGFHHHLNTHYVFQKWLYRKNICSFQCIIEEKTFSVIMFLYFSHFLFGKVWLLPWKAAIAISSYLYLAHCYFLACHMCTINLHHLEENLHWNSRSFISKRLHHDQEKGEVFLSWMDAQTFSSMISKVLIALECWGVLLRNFSLPCVFL